MAQNMTALGAEALATAPADAARLRRVIRLVCVIVFVDTIFFAIVAPLLPSLAHELHLSKLSAGILTGALAAGNLIGSIPGGVFAARKGARSAMVVGLTMLGATTIAFALGTNVVVLDFARFCQGVAEAFTWAGAFAWLVSEAPAERRGSLIGLTVAAAGAGALFGPVVGTVAHALGREAVFVALSAVPFGLALIVRGYASNARAAVLDLAALAYAVTRIPILIGGWLMMLGGGAQALVTVLAPLRIVAIGGTVGTIGVAFLFAAGLESLNSLLAGRLSDRYGPPLPLAVGLACGAVLLPCVVLAGTDVALAAVVVLLNGAVGLIWAPSIAMMSHEADGVDIPQGVAFALTNMTWAIGMIVAAWGGGAVAKAAGDGAALACVATLWAVTAVAVVIRSLAARSS
jgi:MFS family permease